MFILFELILILICNGNIIEINRNNEIDPPELGPNENIQISENCGNECSYEMNGDNLEIQVNGSITKETWKFESSIEYLTIEGEIKSFPPHFISNFLNLKYVTMNTTTIPKGIFATSSISKVTIGQNVEKIEERAFEDCHSLITVKFEEESSVKIIEDHAFRNCNQMLTIQIPSSVETINFKRVFEGCSQLETIEIEDNKHFISDNHKEESYDSDPLC